MRHRIVRAVLAVACSAVAASGAAGGQAHGVGGEFPAGRRAPGPDPGRVQQHHRRPARLSPRRRPMAGAPGPRRPHQPPARAEQGGLHAAAAPAGVALAVPVGGGLGRVRGHRRRGRRRRPTRWRSCTLAAMHFASFALVSPTFFACEGWASLPAADQETCARGRASSASPGGPTDGPSTPSETRRLERFLAGQRRGRSLRRGGGADGGGHSADAHVPFPHPADPGGWPTARASTPRRAGGSWRRASPTSCGTRCPTRRCSRRRRRAGSPLPGPALEAQATADARRPPKARPALVRFHHQWLGTDDVLLVAPARRAFGPAVRHRGPARHRARRRRGVAGDHGAGAPLAEDRDGAFRRAGRLRRGGHVHGADDRPPRLHVGRHRAHLRRRTRNASTAPR